MAMDFFLFFLFFHSSGDQQPKRLYRLTVGLKLRLESCIAAAGLGVCQCVAVDVAVFSEIAGSEGVATRCVLCLENRQRA